MVDLPLPDSPASPKTSPGAIANDTPSTARTAPSGPFPGVRYSTLQVADVEQGARRAVSPVRRRSHARDRLSCCAGGPGWRGLGRRRLS